LKYLDPLLQKVVTATEAAELLQVTRRQISRLCKLDKLDYRDASGILLITKKSVDQYGLNRKKAEEDVMNEKTQS
jgi:hypothetical protein